jgi:hypothetical protein
VSVKTLVARLRRYVDEDAALNASDMDRRAAGLAPIRPWGSTSPANDAYEDLRSHSLADLEALLEVATRLLAVRDILDHHERSAYPQCEGCGAEGDEPGPHERCSAQGEFRYVCNHCCDEPWPCEVVLVDQALDAFEALP